MTGHGALGTSEQEDVRRQRFKQEQQTDLQAFLAAQAKENPRLRHIKRRQSEVVTNIFGAQHQPHPPANPSYNNSRHRHNSSGNNETSQPNAREEYHSRDPPNGRGPSRGYPAEDYDNSRNNGYSDYRRPFSRESPYGGGQSHHPYTSAPASFWPHSQPAYNYGPPPPPDHWRSPPPRSYFDDDNYRRGFGNDVPRSMMPANPYGGGYGDHGGRFGNDVERRDERRERNDSYDREARNRSPPGNHHRSNSHLVSSGSDSRSRQYAADLARQIDEKRQAEERERGYRRQPAYTAGGNPLLGEHSSSSVGARMRNTDSSTTSLPQVQYAARPDQGQPPITASKGEYLRDLDAQIQLKRQNAELEKMKWRQQDEKKEREMADYNPWGRGGAGAPHTVAIPPPVVPQANPTGYFDSQHKSNPNEASYGGARHPPAGNNPSHISAPFAAQQAALPPIGAPAEKSFARSHGPLDAIGQEELAKKHRQQQEHQDALKRQMAERDAKKAQEIAQRRAEEDEEQARINKEQELLHQKYAREQEEARKKEEEARLENEKKIAERKMEQEKRDREFLEAQKRAQDEREKKRGVKSPVHGGSGTTYQEQPPPVHRTSSPPLPATRRKSDAAHAADPFNQSGSQTNLAPPFRSSSPPIPTLRGKSGPREPTVADPPHAQPSPYPPNRREPHPPPSQSNNYDRTGPPPPSQPNSPPPPHQDSRPVPTKSKTIHRRDPNARQNISTIQKPLSAAALEHGAFHEDREEDIEQDDNRAVLSQLVAIQQELAREDREIQTQLHAAGIDVDVEVPIEQPPLRKKPEASRLPQAKDQSRTIKSPAEAKYESQDKKPRTPQTERSRRGPNSLLDDSLLFTQTLAPPAVSPPPRRSRRRSSSRASSPPTRSSVHMDLDNVDLSANRERRKRMVDDFLRQGELDVRENIRQSRRVTANLGDTGKLNDSMLGEGALQSESKLVYLKGQPSNRSTSRSGTYASNSGPALRFSDLLERSSNRDDLVTSETRSKLLDRLQSLNLKAAGKKGKETGPALTFTSPVADDEDDADDTHLIIERVNQMNAARLQRLTELERAQQNGTYQRPKWEVKDPYARNLESKTGKDEDGGMKKKQDLVLAFLDAVRDGPSESTTVPSHLRGRSRDHSMQATSKYSDIGIGMAGLSVFPTA
ncbi:hypothetical protein DFS34DRAFT_634789 [Phlyctochytrium arcticum]|nr:hypothetical protein DFS34DRAFT_634789 [Phlyctochytrium arcticum]